MHRASAWVRCTALIASVLVLDRAPVVGARSPQNPPPAAAIKHPSISRADALAEIEGLFRTIEHVHPNPYSVRSREWFDAERRRIVADLPDTITTTEWWVRLSQLVAGIGDGHTFISYPFGGILLDQLPSLSQQARDDPSRRPDSFRLKAFPRRILALDDAGHLLVASSGGGAGDLRRGDHVLRVNGRSTDALLAEWMLTTSGDTDANRVASTVDDFPLLLLLHSMLPPYTLIVSDGASPERTVTIEGTPLGSAGGPASPSQAFFTYRTLDAGVGYMDFFTMDGSRRAFKKALAAMFRRVGADSVRTLIVDLRRNGGGYEDFGNDLLSYVTTKPYRNWGRREIKRSAEMRAFGRTEYIPWPLRWLPVQYLIPDGRKFYTGEVGTMAVWPEPLPTVHERSKPFFPGAVCLLTGPRTFSAAVVFADTVKTYHLATIVGEATGGRPNMYSAQYEYSLANSRLSAAVSAAYTVRASGDEGDRSPVAPDIAVSTTAADIRDGRDPVLERARDCPSVL